MMGVNDARLHVVLPADVFPPGKVGGAAWSSLALATTLHRRGHAVTVIVPRRGARGVTRREMDGFAVVEVGYAAPRLPFVQNYFRFERLWPRLSAVIVEVAQAGPLARTVIHAQHAQTGPAAVLAGQSLGVPALVTVRDHWPWDYFSTGLHGDRVPYNRTTAASLLTDLVARQGPVRGVFAAPAIPYMLAHLRRRAALLGRADAVIAVSHYIAQRLEAVVARERIRVVPNIVDTVAIDRVVADWAEPMLPGERASRGKFGAAVVADALPPAAPEVKAIASPFVLFVGKLERNKGAHLLPQLMHTQPGDPLLVIAGDGSLRGTLERELRAAQVRFHLLPGWTAHDDVLRLMARAEVLLFPSAWGEPLSRVLLEATACGACIAALNTGGTADVIVHNESGVLATTAAALRAQLAALLTNPLQRVRLREGARRRAETTFAPGIVAAEMERVYEALVARG